MKIDVIKIDQGRFVIREEYDDEYIAQLADSLQEDGQWKILKFAYRQAFMCSYEKGWVEEPVAVGIAG